MYLCLRDRPTCVRNQRQSTFRYTDPQAAAVGAAEAPFTATVPVSEVARTATYTRGYATYRIHARPGVPRAFLPACRR
jgi:hypothetical protein